MRFGAFGCGLEDYRHHSLWHSRDIQGHRICLLLGLECGAVGRISRRWKQSHGRNAALMGLMEDIATHDGARRNCRVPTGAEQGPL